MVRGNACLRPMAASLNNNNEQGRLRWLQGRGREVPRGRLRRLRHGTLLHSNAQEDEDFRSRKA